MTQWLTTYQYRDTGICFLSSGNAITMAAHLQRRLIPKNGRYFNSRKQGKSGRAGDIFGRESRERIIKSAVCDLLGKNQRRKKEESEQQRGRVSRTRGLPVPGDGHRSDEEAIRQRRSAKRQLRSFLLPSGTSCTVMNKGGWESRTIGRRVSTFTTSFLVRHLR